MMMARVNEKKAKKTYKLLVFVLPIILTLNLSLLGLPILGLDLRLII